MVIPYGASKAGDLGNHCRQFADGNIFTVTCIDVAAGLHGMLKIVRTVEIQQEKRCPRHIVDMQKFATRVAATPNQDPCGSCLDSFVKPPVQCRKHMKGLEIELISRTGEIFRQYNAVVSALLQVRLLQSLMPAILATA